MLKKILTALALMRGDARGSVSMEAGVAVAALGMFVLGVVDLAYVAVSKLELYHAAKVGVQYGTQDYVTAADHDRILDAVAAEIGARDGYEISISDQCHCRNGGATSCDATCEDGLYAPLYVEVVLQDEVEVPFGFPGLPEVYDVQAKARMRVR